MADQGQTESFIVPLTELGGSAGNGRLREALQWDDATYPPDLSDAAVQTVLAQAEVLLREVSAKNP